VTDVVGGPGTVGSTARALGFAGLLPQVAAVLMVATDLDRRSGEVLALTYGALILSFLGGMWWSFAMRRSTAQGSLALLAVMPSLAALAIAMAAGLFISIAAALVALGIAVLLSLVVDRHLVATGEAPEEWMRLRVPLSIGLGSLTLLAGLL